MVPPPAPEAVDTFACGWETVNTTPEKTLDAATLKQQLAALLQEFRKSHAAAAAAAPQEQQQQSPTLFQHGFLLYLLHRQQKDRSTTSSLDYTQIIQYYKQSKMDLQGATFSGANATLLYPLLAKNTECIECATPVDGLTILEARVLLSLYQYPLEYRNPQQQVLLFQMLVKEFAKGLKAVEEGRVGAKVLWEAFLGFLRKVRLEFVGFFGSHQEFNEVLWELGWEQKRVASGKVWLRMACPTVGANVVAAASASAGASGANATAGAGATATNSDTAAVSSAKA